MIGDLDAADSVLGNVAAPGQRRAADTDDSEEACGSVLDGLLHVLAEVTHPSGFNVRADGWARIGRSVSQTERREFSSRDYSNRIGDGFENKTSTKRAHKFDGGYIPRPVPARRRKYTPNNMF